MEKASANIGIGEPITDVMDLVRLAKEGKSVVQSVAYCNKKWIVRPAAFYIHWSLYMLSIHSFYYSVKL